MNSEEFSCIKQVVKTVQLSLPLMYISNEFAGITGVLDSWRRQYVKQLQGIVVSYRNVSLTSRYGAVSTQRSYVIYNVKATFDLFCPNIGDIVKGKINRISKEHIGCLIQETINVNIHLPRNSPSGLSKYIYLDREILFEISHFSCEPKVIRVTGDITAKCIELMNDLFPAVEEDVVNSQSGDENNTSDREVGGINLSMLNSVKKAEGKSKKSKKRKRESESSALESTEESPKKETVKVEVKTPKKRKMRSLDEQLTDSPGKTPKIKNLSNNLDEDLSTLPEKTPKKKKSKKKKDSIENNVIQSPKKEIKSYLDTSDLDETVELNQEHLNLLDSIKSEVGLLETPTKSKGSGEKNTKKRKREAEGSTAKKDKKHKKKNKDGSKSKDKKNPSKKKSKVSASGTVLKKDKKKSKAKKAAKKDDKSKPSKSKKNRKKDKSEKRKSKKLKLSTDDDIKDVIKEIKEE